MKGYKRFGRRKVLSVDIEYGKRVRVARKALKMSQHDLARASGIPRWDIYKLEVLGEIKWSDERDKIAQALPGLKDVPSPAVTEATRANWRGRHQVPLIETYPEFGRRVREARVRAQMTQKQLGDRLAMSVHYVSRLETRGDIHWSDTRVKVADVFPELSGYLWFEAPSSAPQSTTRTKEELLRKADKFQDAADPERVRARSELCVKIAKRIVPESLEGLVEDISVALMPARHATLANLLDQLEPEIRR